MRRRQSAKVTESFPENLIKKDINELKKSEQINYGSNG